MVEIDYNSTFRKTQTLIGQISTPEPVFNFITVTLSKEPNIEHINTIFSLWKNSKCNNQCMLKFHAEGAKHNIKESQKSRSHPDSICTFTSHSESILNLWTLPPKFPFRSPSWHHLSAGLLLQDPLNLSTSILIFLQSTPLPPATDVLPKGKYNPAILRLKCCGHRPCNYIRRDQQPF